MESHIPFALSDVLIETSSLVNQNGDSKCITGHQQIMTTKVLCQNKRVMFGSRNQMGKQIPSCEEQLQMFTSNINELTDKHFPTKTVVRQTTEKPWVSDKFRDLIHQLKHSWKAGDQALYRLYRNKVGRLRKSLKQTYYDKHTNGLKLSNPCKWWKGMKELLECQKVSCASPRQSGV